MTLPVQIVPSVLPADFGRLGEAVAAFDAAGADKIQWDVMDGHFVPNLTFGPDIIAAARPYSTVPFEAHLMVERPDDLVHMYVDAGCEMLIIHAETTPHLHRTLGKVAELGSTAAVALNPSTPIDVVLHVADLIDMVLVMTVNPGFGGQRYIATMEPKIAALRTALDSAGHARVSIEVDGGISANTIAGASSAGADVFISGSALFGYPEGLSHGVADLRARAEAART
ncbi:MAG: ribulose-phosphate 3-epimerase [Actinobacteria bacterium]|nr:ribulose-phosphate 3-epimerase [Actinomycetota bacterium]